MGPLVPALEVAVGVAALELAEAEARRLQRRVVEGSSRLCEQQNNDSFGVSSQAF